ncbi:STAS domain-containing protein [Streptomyces sp. NPDC093260]|uniref:STAS domain-containing protein n=1 Tax=Streptomyces sp. NPDC093260 TaxID=3155073 RepID=UPI003431BE3C
MLQVTERTDDEVVARLPQDVDLYTTPGLRAVGDRIIDEGCRHLVLDASDTLHVDSTGITLIITWYRRLDRMGGAVVLTQVQDHLCDLLLRLGLGTVMTITRRTARPDSPNGGG